MGGRVRKWREGGGEGRRGDIKGRRAARGGRVQMGGMGKEKRCVPPLFLKPIAAPVCDDKRPISYANFQLSKLSIRSVTQLFRPSMLMQFFLTQVAL